MQNILKRLKTEFSAKQKKDYILLLLPVVINLDSGLLNLRIAETETGYTISCPRNFFVDANESLEFYFNVFEKYDKNYHYDMQIKKGKLTKDYSQETNIITAINEFVRFIILFDNFIINNDVIGNEEHFILN